MTDPDAEQARGSDGLSRRGFLKGMGLAAAAGGVSLPALDPAAQDETRADGPAVLRGEVPVALRINGREHRLALEPRTTLLSVLRYHLDPPLTGTKLSCDHGTCGACTVLLDGRPAYACMILALDAAGREITTVEGLSEGETLSPVQEAMRARDATMCGFCTPGFAVALTACLESNPDPTREEIQEACAGNLCRCGTHPHVFEAALDAARARKEEKR